MIGILRSTMDDTADVGLKWMLARNGRVGADHRQERDHG